MFATAIAFSCYQEEHWHEANTFPSVPQNKDDFVLFLGKILPPHPRPSTSTGTTPSHRWTSSSSSAAVIAATNSTTSTGGSTLETYFTADAHSGDETCTAVSGVNCAVPRAMETSAVEDHPDNRRGVEGRTGSSAGRHAAGGEEWDGDAIDEHVEDESDVEEESDGCRAGVPSSSSPERAESAAEGCTEGGTDPARPRGVGMRKRLSSRIANWRKPKVRVGVCLRGEKCKVPSSVGELEFEALHREFLVGQITSTSFLQSRGSGIFSRNH